MDTRLSTNTPGGVALIVLGLMFFLVTQGGFDLNWGNSLPLFMIVAGALAPLPLLRDVAPAARGSAATAGNTMVLLGAASWRPRWT